MQKQFDEVIYKAQEAAKYGNTSATGGLLSNNSSSSSSGGGSSGSSSKSSTSKKTSSSSSKTNKNDGVAHGWYYHIRIDDVSMLMPGIFERHEFAICK